MTKKYLLFFFFIFRVNLFFPETAEEIFFNNTFNAFKESINQYAIDISNIAGLYNASGEVRGAASIGSFPSFRVNATFGVLFYRNPLFFLKRINFANFNWDNMLDKGGVLLSWLDDNFLPLPMAYYSFDIGLPKGFSVGMKFNYVPYGEVIKGAASGQNLSQEIKSLLPFVNVWQLGFNFNYCIIKDYKFFPSVAIGGGISYTDSRWGIDSFSIGSISYDTSNDNISTSIGFNSITNTTSFFIDFTVSKKFVFFEPFVSIKFIQSVNHNLTKYIVKMDLSNATDEFKSVFKEEIVISNRKDIDPYGNEIGDVIPSTEFIIATGFEFVIVDMVRLGLEATYGFVSKCGIVSLGMKFQMERFKFQQFKKGANK